MHKLNILWYDGKFYQLQHWHKKKEAMKWMIQLTWIFWCCFNALEVFLDKNETFKSTILFFEDGLTGSQTPRQWQLFGSCELLGLVGSMGLIAVEDKQPENIDKVITYFDKMIDKNDMNQWLMISHAPIVETEWLPHIASIFGLIVCVNSLSARCFRWKHGRWK